MDQRSWLRDNLALGFSIFLWLVLATINYLSHEVLTIPDWVVLYSLIGFLLLVERFQIEISNGEVFSPESGYYIGFSLVYHAHIVIWAGLAFAFISSLRYKKFWYDQVFNALDLMICALTARYAYHLFTASTAVLSLSNISGVLIYGVVYFVCNIVLLSVYVTIKFGSSRLVAILKGIRLQIVLVYSVTIMLGAIMSLVLRIGGIAGAILVTGLILLVSYSYKDYFKMANHFRELSIKDELTGLHNHRYIQSAMDKLITEQTQFALLMLDIDHFKRYNEQLGHVQGDEALKILANVLSSMREQGEEIARYSGEEFLIVLPGYDAARATLKAELVRKEIEGTAFPGEEVKKRVTVSVGVAMYPETADNKKELLMAVDDALYKGKFTGRNRVSIYSSVLDELQDLQITEEDQEIVKTIKVFLAILNSKDRYTLAHTERDVLYADALAEIIGLPEERRRYLRFGSFLHDIGKVEVPHEVLTKRGPLTRDEWIIMKSHVEIGEKIARPIPGLAPCLPIIRHHHERYDGKGYPDGLAGEEIPLEARILTIADSFDAMTTSRPYQKKRNLESAIKELRACAGAQFDPALVEPFIEVVTGIGLLSNEEEAEELA